jgi:hypothetical protein
MAIFRIIAGGSQNYIDSIAGAKDIVEAMIALQEKIQDGSCDKYLMGTYKKFVGHDLNFKAVWQSLPESIVILDGGIKVYTVESSGTREELMYIIQMDIKEAQRNNCENDKSCLPEIFPGFPSCENIVLNWGNGEKY